MAENTNSGGGGNAGLAFIVGGLLVVVIIIAFFVFRGGMPGADTKKIDVDINVPEVSAPAAPAAN